MNAGVDRQHRRNSSQQSSSSSSFSFSHKQQQQQPTSTSAAGGVASSPMMEVLVAKAARQSSRRIRGMSILLLVCLLYRSGTMTSRTNIDIEKNKQKDDGKFEARNLDVTRKGAAPCGQYKCFFKSVANSEVGFLVAPSQRKKNSSLAWFETLEAGWNLSQTLQESYNVQHFLLEPPIKVEKVSRELFKKLNKHLYSEKKVRFMRGRHSTRFPKGSTVYVQKVKTAPKRSMVIGCADSKLVPFKRNVKNFAKAIKYTNNFGRNFNEGLETAKLILQQEPCMTKDFQVLVDEKGRFYHLDFDRCFLPDAPGAKYQVSDQETTSCLKALDDMESRIQQELKKLS